MLFSTLVSLWVFFPIVFIITVRGGFINDRIFYIISLCFVFLQSYYYEHLFEFV